MEKKTLVEIISFDVKQVEVLGFLGPIGPGKT
ncbi:ABC transporter ATP-binding protein, partial [Bacillus tropicus]|nr:ABC transporter ATP-binding protein [Bacillus tropicus]